MRPLTYVVATTLDGRTAAPDGALDFFVDDPAHLVDLAADWGDAFPTAFHAAFGTRPPGTRFDAVVIGRETFEPALRAGTDDPYAHLDTHVCSTTLDPAAHPGVTVVADDPVAHMRALEAADGLGVWLCGGGRLAAVLVDEIDRLVVKLNPVAAGAGRALLDGGFDPQLWRLVSTRTFEAGVVLLEHERVEAPAAGPTAPAAPATRVARGTFEVDLRPGAEELGGAVGRFDFDKTFRGDLEATGSGVMLTAGDPAQGSAGYVALESVSGVLDGRRGGFVLQQLGLVDAGADADLHGRPGLRAGRARRDHRDPRPDRRRRHPPLRARAPRLSPVPPSPACR